ncbi:uncharacterized protein KY384_004264 [Bacidia gigantensis]|uniref:uncharacterized protein n=1 Tax=Bacidia gigantensis TaxID=2732470 RepID=UPI001D04FF89|nr:uncharacterized protein KY384_004264 [Bacidia gigantensis]KAG8530907.1 hypothetical protein KY384_004264 [Bacidia gigantensis]
MNPNIPGQRYRGPQDGAPMGPGARPGHDVRNGHPQPGMLSPPPASNGFHQGGQMSRAEKFEDEKKRIIESCFSKKDPDGSLNESYITHIRVQEDEDHPQSPPPSDSLPQKKKPRVVMVAVRKSGRVRMHKGRENANGTFSIGKTWSLDDLNRVESFAHAMPQTAEEQQYNQPASDSGFVVTLQKPYYWQAASAKEKEFFIFSLIKIFKKYTGGRLPELIGFSSQELEQLGASAGQPSTDTPRPRPNGHPVPTNRVPSQDPPPRAARSDAQPPEASRERRRRPSQEQRPTQPERTLHSTAQQEHRLLHSATSRDRALRNAPSNERMRLPGAFPSTDSIHSQTSQSMRSRRSESPNSMKAPSYSTTSNSRAPSENRHEPSSSYETAPPFAQSVPSGRSSSEQSRLNGTYPTQARIRAHSQARSESTDERPRTAAKGSDIPPALEIRSPKHRPPTTSSDSNSQLEGSIYSQKSRTQPSESMNGDRRAGSRQGRQSDRDMNAPAPPSLGRSRSKNDIRPPKPPSQDGLERIPKEEPRKFKEPIESPVVATKPESIPSETQIDPTPTPDHPESQSVTETHRPGLGPMIKKKSNAEIANKFRKAATAYNAFKPRPGMPGEKGLSEQSSTGDGITGVFQASTLLRGVSQDDARPGTPGIKIDSRPATPDAKKENSLLSLTTSPAKQTISPSQDPSRLQEPVDPLAAEKVEAPAAITKPPVPPQDERRKKRQSDHSAKYAKSLGINPSLLEGRTFEIEAILNDFGWGEDSNKTTFENLETGIRKELARVEAGSWLGAVDNSDDRTLVVGDMIDKVMAECEELDCLLTLYNVELGTLSEDVAYIEAQSQGLQVQTANQKLLHTELRNLLDNISISSSQLRILKDASLFKTRGIREIESVLSQLYTAMSMIDPKLRHDEDAGPPDQANAYRKSSVGQDATELSSMHAVREKRELFQRESSEFVQRLKHGMNVIFQESETQTMDALDRAKAGNLVDSPRLDERLREKPKQDLWMYSALLLFVREIQPLEWENLMKLYDIHARKPYQDEMRENMLAWRKITQKPSGDEQDVLFTAQEKEHESLVGRKLTVKRSKTVRADGPSRISSGERPKDGKHPAYVAFASILTGEARLILIEQNFIVKLFHVSSLDTQDFADAIASEPGDRQPSDLDVKQPPDPNRTLARKVLGVMEDIFSFWPAEVQGLVDWFVKQDSMNAVGMLYTMETQLSNIEETNQEFLSQTIGRIHDRLITQFSRFIEEQVRGIEDTKVKIKKRKGVINFIKIFPGFSVAIEKMLPPTALLPQLQIRGIVDDAYRSINKAMFESLKFIAKESPTASHSHLGTSLGDNEDKEALNHHILIIENMSHYIEETTLHNNRVLEEWNSHAQADMQEHLDLYLASVLRRPLGKLLDFVESTETLLSNSLNSSPPSAIAQRPSHSRQVFKKVLSSYDAKEIRRGVEALKKRVEKHFGEADDSAILVNKVLKACEARYQNILERVGKLVRDVYSGGLEVEWRREDVNNAFKK